MSTPYPSTGARAKQYGGHRTNACSGVLVAVWLSGDEQYSL